MPDAYVHFLVKQKNITSTLTHPSPSLPILTSPDKKKIKATPHSPADYHNVQKNQTNQYATTRPLIPVRNIRQHTGPNRSSWPPSTRPSPPPPRACPYKTLISDLSRPGTQPIKRIPQLLFATTPSLPPPPRKNSLGEIILVVGGRPHDTLINPPPLFFTKKKGEIQRSVSDV